MSRGADPRWLAAVPVVVLAGSYVVLVRYHGSWWLWGTVVHESGRLTLLETTLYASHFLGHVPVYVVLALLTAGSFAAVAGDRGRPRPAAHRVRWLVVSVAVLTAAATVASLAWFGVEDTVAYVLQQRQRAGSYEAGGSWALHLPSTQLQLVLIPLVAAAATWWFAGRLRPSTGGCWMVGSAVAGIAVMTVAVGGADLMVEVWSRPRYLAHSVRELVTFPLLYYPLPLAVWLAELPRVRPRSWPARGTMVVLATLAGVLAAGLGIQVAVSLAAGVDTMSQRPAFAGGAPLGIPYLLASHFFEHVLDAAFFVLTALALDAVRRWRRTARTPDAEAGSAA